MFHHHLSSQNHRTSSAPAGALNFRVRPDLLRDECQGELHRIRRSPGVSPGMRHRISSGTSAGRRFLAHLSSRMIFETWPAKAGPNKEANYGQETTTLRRPFSTERPASVAEASRLKPGSSEGRASFTATKS